MNETEVIEISDESDIGEDLDERRKFLEPIVQGVVDALGGQEGGVYRLGDQVNGCLKDLKKLWRKDETDDERTVARIFWKTRVFINDLIPIILVTAGKGMVEDKRAIACADLMTAMTWPIDLAEELKELDDELDRNTDYTILLQSHLHYKAALLKSGVLEALFGIVLPPLAKSPKERTERDGQIVNVVLHLVRNLAFIKDLPPNMHLSADQAEYSMLQSRLICALSETHMLKLLLTIAANSEKDPLFDSWNTVVLETLYLLFRGVQPSSLVEEQTKQPAEELRRLLNKEELSKRHLARQPASRHSRFGTTISVKLNPNKKTEGVEGGATHSAGSKPFVLHRQQGISGEAGNIWDMAKRQKAKKGQTVDDLARNDNISVEARMILQSFATDFLEGCFNPFLATLLKDIRAERGKITEKDHLRLLYVTKWFLNFFLSKLERAKTKATDELEMWSFGLVAEVVERGWIIWVLKRMRQAVEEKPKLWTELQAGIECLTQLLKLIDTMSSTEINDTALSEAADVLQQQLIYGGDVLDIALESMRTYKEGTQSLAYLESSVNMAYTLLKMLEKWSKGKGKRGEMYVRKKKAKKRKGTSDAEEVPDVEEEREEDEGIIQETIFTFEAFEMKFAQADITHTLLAYLARYKEFTNLEDMRRVVSLLHRQAVRAKAEGLFFKVSTLDLFKTILADQKSLPREQPYKDLVNLINFILRRFFKALEEEPFLAIEAFFPKNRGNWKQFSSWEPPAKGSKQERTAQDTRFPQEVRVKKGHSWSDQVGISIAALVEAGQTELVLWTQEILQTAKDERQRIVLQTDVNDGTNSDNENDDPKALLTLQGPSLDARAKMTDYLIPYLNDEHAEAATKNPYLKLLFRLSKFHILDEDADELEWYIPAAILPDELQSVWNVITQFLETPYDLEGKKVSQLLSKKARRRRKVTVQESEAEDASDEDKEEAKERRRKKKKIQEEQQYKSAQFIEDSDEEYGDIDAFLELEKQRREKAALKVAALGEGRTGTMRSTGTKKRRRKAGDTGERKKKRKGDGTAVEIPKDDSDASDGSGQDSEESLDVPAQIVNEVTVPPSRPRPRPKPKPKVIKPSENSSTESSTEQNGHEPSLVSSSVSGEPDTVGLSSRRKGRLILSDDE